GLCRTLEDAGQIDWFEEPVPPESFRALRQIPDKVNAPRARSKGLEQVAPPCAELELGRA
ncbi:MAG: hypothetical protein E5X61_04845, partial [Mesorhizobium sp.]